MYRVPLFVLIILASVPIATAQTACPEQKLTCANGVCRLEVTFPGADVCQVRIDDKFIVAQKAGRITENTVFRVHLLRVNLLRYAVQFDTKETVVDSYVYLEKLWKQVIGLGALAAPAAVPPEGVSKQQAFVDAINVWRDALDAAVGSEGDGLSAFVNNFKSLTLTNEEMARIAQRAAGVGDRLAALERLRIKAKQAISRAEEFPIYDATLATHDAVGDKFAAFSALAAQIAVGVDKKVSFGAAGRVVAVAISAKDRATGAEQPQAVSVEFFVHSTLPVTFHAGYTVRNLADVEFKEVAGSLATAGGADLFSKVQDTDANGTFTGFLSYRICDATKLRHCPYLTIGTDFKDVGDRLYGGVSWPVGRAFLTVGAVSGETKEGTGPITDVLSRVGQLTESRELFTAVATNRKWGWFAGISFAPF